MRLGAITLVLAAAGCDASAKPSFTCQKIAGFADTRACIAEAPTDYFCRGGCFTQPTAYCFPMASGAFQCTVTKEECAGWLPPEKKASGCIEISANQMPKGGAK